MNVCIIIKIVNNPKVNNDKNINKEFVFSKHGRKYILLEEHLNKLFIKIKLL